MPENCKHCGSRRIGIADGKAFFACGSSFNEDTGRWRILVACVVKRGEMARFASGRTQAEVVAALRSAAQAARDTEAKAR